LRYYIKNLTKRIIYMAKLYSKRNLAKKTMLPKKETIRLLLQYSCALSIIKVGSMNFETFAN